MLSLALPLSREKPSVYKFALHYFLQRTVYVPENLGDVGGGTAFGEAKRNGMYV